MHGRAHWVILAIANLALVGCRYHDPSIDLLESELRWMEDQLYLLEDEVQTKTRELDLWKNGQLTKTPCDPATASQVRPTASGDSTPELLPPSDGNSPLMEAPRIELPSPSDDSGPSPTPAELPSGSTERDNGRGTGPLDGQYSPPILEFPSAQTVSPDHLIVQQSFETPLVEPDFDPYVTHLVLRSQLADGQDFDGRPGVEGLLVVVEPRNADGQYVPLSGAVSIVALDAAQEGPAARIARWDFDAAEVGRKLRKSKLGRGAHLELPWPEEPPQTDQLHVFARYLTADGRKLQADRTVDADDSHPTIHGWTPAKRGPRPVASQMPSPSAAADRELKNTPGDSLETRSQSVLAVAQQLEKSVAAIEETLSTGAVPRQLTPPLQARPLMPPADTSERPISRPRWQPDR